MSEVPLYPGFEARVSDFGFRGAAAASQGFGFRGGLVFNAHRLCVSLNSRLESHKDEKVWGLGFRVPGSGFRV